MRILVLGSGGREHAIAANLEWSGGADGDDVFVAPGNAGTCRNLPVDPLSPEAVVRLCRDNSIEFVVIGPETIIEAGVTDALLAAGIAVFAPTKAAARLETSKAFCRTFASRHGVPSPAFAVIDQGQIEAARDWSDQQPFDVVVKADGLAAGKGVVVPESIAERDAAIVQLVDQGPIVLEERLTGIEVSLLVFTDGTTIRPMPPAQDHKRIFEADLGPNTGGMGAFAPTSACPPDMVRRIIDEIVRPTIDGMRAEGNPFVGVLYAGVMVTPSGPKLIEYNCRFGDPEAQVLLPLLRTNLRDVMLACTHGALADIDIQWNDGVACTVVLSASGYPATPRVGDVITGLTAAAQHEDTWIFHAGTAREAASKGASIVTAGGRVLAVTSLASDLPTARKRAYAAANAIHFDGKYMRRDIGWRELARTTGGYAASGVDIDEGNRAVSLMKAKVESSHDSRVLAGVGAFGGVVSLSSIRRYDDPVLVASTDGVGTKVMLAAELGNYESIGHDIVNHCVDDILVQGARPLVFLDYIASSSLSADMVATVVGGMADACKANGCSLLGGETAEMPGVYSDGHFDVAGTIVGLAEKSRLFPRPQIEPGDVLIGIASSGLHTNGYSLARRVFAGLPLDVVPPPLTTTLGEALLEPHRSYLPVLEPLLDTDLIKAMAHITGGGFYENLPRVLPVGCGARVNRSAWVLPPLFSLIAEVSRLPADELYRTLNMGIGMVLVVAPGDASEIRRRIAEETWVIGDVISGDRGVVLE